MAETAISTKIRTYLIVPLLFIVLHLMFHLKSAAKVYICREKKTKCVALAFAILYTVYLQRVMKLKIFNAMKGESSGDVGGG